jgi:hypothetical protein
MAVKAVAILGAGLVSAALTAGLVAAIRILFSYDIFSFWIWGWVPAGPLVCGILSGLGLYAACIGLNVRANSLLLIASLSIGSVTYVLAYGLWYWAIRDNLPPGLGFAQFLNRAVTRDNFSVDVMRWAVDLGPVGKLGYVFAAINLVAVTVGGRWAYKLVAERPWCDECGGFFRTVGGPREAYFTTPEELSHYREETARAAERPEPLVALLARAYLRPADGEGVHHIESTLRRCGRCRRQVVQESVQAYKDGWWQCLEDEGRVLEVSPRADLATVFDADL